MSYPCRPEDCDHRTRKGIPVIQVVDGGLRCDVCDGLYSLTRILQLLSVEDMADVLKNQPTMRGSAK